MLYFTQPKQLWYFIGACMLRGFGASGNVVHVKREVLLRLVMKMKL